jgi:hypothetical protein
LIVDLNSRGFLLKVEKDLKDNLSCRVIPNIEGRDMLILQTHLISKLIDKFGNEVSNKKVYGTPGIPRFKVTRPDEDSDTIPESLQKKYLSGVGMLLSLIKYSRPDLNNAIRELSKCMDRATYGTYQEMLCIVKFVLDTKNYCLIIQPNFDSKNSWKWKVFWTVIGLVIWKRGLV